MSVDVSPVNYSDSDSDECESPLLNNFQAYRVSKPLVHKLYVSPLLQVKKKNNVIIN